ncbi:hypothetical protein [Campylobacter sp. JMF_08 NE1]|uniref:hypothetical protein n=1 Tax=Campylobacter sp. JMF_08 NE1 TaxID=2983821 RepID=UPI0022E99B1D|nr:hypothetical protein [Campylobacter sp. JMF_08 NE1]MDA3047368.1 hypothetical protein [Campylobacter sp. JMF_08 NE1]
MRKILCAFSAVLAGILLGGCLAKSAKPYTYYELKYDQKHCAAKSNSRKNIYIESVTATNLVDRRDILIVDWKSRTRYASDAKYITMPSEMLYKALIDAAFSTCALNPIFVPQERDLRLKTTLITLQVDGDHAKITIGYEFLNAVQSIKSGVITKRVFVPDPSSQSIYNATNSALNLAIDEILKAIQ